MTTPIIIHWLKLKARICELLAGSYNRRADYFRKLGMLHNLASSRKLSATCYRKANKCLNRAIYFLRKANAALTEVCDIRQAQVDYEQSRRD